MEHVTMILILIIAACAIAELSWVAYKYYQEHEYKRKLRLRRNGRPTPTFITLPPEIRNQIYGYALGGNKFTVRPGTTQRPPKHALALLRVCRQINYETAILPYTLNTFCDWGTEGFVAFLTRRTAEQLQAIKSLELITHTEARRVSQRNSLGEHALGLLAGLPSVKKVGIGDWGAGYGKRENRERTFQRLRECKGVLKGMWPGVQIMITNLSEGRRMIGI